MNPIVLLSLAALCAILMILERRGLPTTLELHFKGDVKRETRWLAQYGQSLCTPVAAVLVYQLDPGSPQVKLHKAITLIAGVLAASIIALIIKRSLGRVRPGRENAGKFLGPTLKHANFRESFPSSHSACAVAMSVILAIWYPPAAPTFWALGIGCAVLRWILDAHWPSDVVAGITLGYAIGCWTVQLARPYTI